MENCEKRGELVGFEYSTSWSACSACAGDYEDPDRTAAPSEDELKDEDESGGAEDEEDFLARETMPQE